jgi:hypothetical protein
MKIRHETSFILKFSGELKAMNYSYKKEIGFNRPRIKGQSMKWKNAAAPRTSKAQMSN